MKSKYQLMKDGVYIDEFGNNYPDLATFPIETFTNEIKPIVRELTYNDTQRFFDLSYAFYKDFDFYDDFTLWINNIDQISDSDNTFGKKILLYDKNDIDIWFKNNVK